MRRTALLIAALLPPLALGWYLLFGREEWQPPDVVIFLVDTLRADWTQPHGFELETTPHLKALAGESVVFEQASSPGPWTLPSVTSIFTGRHVVEHNVVHDRVKLPERATTLAELLRDWGYDTLSYHHNPYAGANWGNDQGFAVSERIEHLTDGVTMQGFYEELTPRPYFLYVHNTEPHDPHNAARGRFREVFEPVDDGFLQEYGNLVKSYRHLTRVDYARNAQPGTTDNSEAQIEKMARLNELRSSVHNIYSIAVRDADARIGSLVATIKKKGRWNDTLFIVLADHGEEMADHGGWQHDQSVYQELIHVPLIVHFPDGRWGGRRVKTPVSLVDVMPTVLDVARCPTEVKVSGQSLVSLLEDGEPAEPEPRIVAMRHNEKKYFRPFKEQRGDLNVAVRKGHWKGIFNVELGTFELYDLARDPGERRELSAEHPDVAGELERFAARRYAELLAGSDRALAGGLDPSDAATLRALEELGYIGGENE